MRPAERSELHDAAAEVDVRRALVDDVRLDQLDPLELLCDGLAEGAEQIGVGQAFSRSSSSCARL